MDPLTLYIALFVLALAMCVVAGAATKKPSRACLACGLQTPIDGARCRHCGYQSRRY